MRISSADTFGKANAMTTLPILCGMAMLALGTLVLGVALISRRPLPPPPEPPDDYSKGESKP
jgi:hypothetical protein